MSAFGPLRHFAAAQQTVAFGGIADIESMLRRGARRLHMLRLIYVNDCIDDGTDRSAGSRLWRVLWSGQWVGRTVVVLMSCRDWS